MRMTFAFLFWLVIGTAVAGAQVNAVPMISEPLVPTSAAPGHKTFWLTVNGT
jgi:hypothetical protein